MPRTAIPVSTSLIARASSRAASAIDAVAHDRARQMIGIVRPTSRHGDEPPFFVH